MQAQASWRWWNFYEDRISPPRLMLKMNLDETSLCVHQGDLRGALFLRKERRRELVQRVTRGKRRTNVTFVATICDDQYIQERIPQFLIANESTFKAKDMIALRLAAGPNVIVLRRKSAWNNEHVMCSITRRIRTSLEEVWATVQSILMFDSAALHLTGLRCSSYMSLSCSAAPGRVLRTCKSIGMWPFVTPPRMTWRLAPLDTHGFHPFKIALKHEYQRRRAGNRHGIVDTVDFVTCVREAVIRVLHRRNWSSAFEHNGYGSRQSLIHTTTLKDLRLASAVGLEPGCPSQGELSLCLPTNKSKIATLVRNLFIDAPCEEDGTDRQDEAAGNVVQC